LVEEASTVVRALGTHEGVRPLPEEIRDVIDTIGVSYRPEDMGITWDDVAPR